VDATQQILRNEDNDITNKDNMEEEEVEQVEQINMENPPEGVECQNREFLRQSWANMQEDEAAEHRLLQHLETEFP
jgi:hypothetical protein